MASTVVSAPPAPPPAVPATQSAWHNPSGFGFRDVLDIINPLQHIPIISSIYRYVTGDRPGEAAEIAGDGLYGGPIGVAFGLINVATEDKSGRGIGGRVLAALFGPDEASAKVAAASTAPKTTTAAPSVAAGPPGQVTPAAYRPATPVAVPDHPPMPLYRAGPMAFGPAPTGTAATPNAAQAFIAHNAMLERQISTGVHAGPPSAPVPLVLPAGTLPYGAAGYARPFPSPAVAPVAPAAPQATPPKTPPTDIAQKILDGLDKYRRMEEERKTPAPNPAAPTSAPASGVDLSL